MIPDAALQACSSRLAHEQAMTTRYRRAISMTGAMIEWAQSSSNIYCGELDDARKKQLWAEARAAELAYDESADELAADTPGSSHAEALGPHGQLEAGAPAEGQADAQHPSDPAALQLQLQQALAQVEALQKVNRVLYWVQREVRHKKEAACSQAAKALGEAELAKEAAEAQAAQALKDAASAEARREAECRALREQLAAEQRARQNVLQCVLPLQRLDVALQPAVQAIQQLRRPFEDLQAQQAAQGRQQGGEEDPAPRHCVVCWSAPREVTGAPCGHLAMCKGCAATMMQAGRPCPVCNAPLSMLLRTFQP